MGKPDVGSDSSVAQPSGVNVYSEKKTAFPPSV